MARARQQETAEPQDAVQTAREQVAQLEERARTQPDLTRELGEARAHLREVERVAAEADFGPPIAAVNAADLGDAEEIERLARAMRPIVERFRARSAQDGRALRNALKAHRGRFGSAPAPPMLRGPGWPALMGWAAGVVGALKVLDRARERAANPPPPPAAVPPPRLLGGASPRAERQRETLVQLADGKPIGDVRAVGPGGRRG